MTVYHSRWDLPHGEHGGKGQHSSDEGCEGEAALLLVGRASSWARLFLFSFFLVLNLVVRQLPLFFYTPPSSSRLFVYDLLPCSLTTHSFVVVSVVVVLSFFSPADPYLFTRACVHWTAVTPYLYPSFFLPGLYPVHSFVYPFRVFPRSRLPARQLPEANVDYGIITSAIATR